MELLERHDLRRALHRAAQEAQRGAGSTVLLAGEAGAGKTALVRALAADCTDRLPVLVGACDPLTTPRPLGPVQDVAAGLSPAVVVALGSGTAAHDTATAVLAALRAGPPRVLVVEDAHWADEATLDLLRVLGRRAGSAPALLLVTYRDDEVGPTHPLRLLLGDLAGAPDVTRLRVPLLSAEAVAAVAAAHGLDPVALHAATDGNPFFVSEVVSGGGTGALPETVRDAVLARVGRLEPGVRALVDLASLVPSRAERSLLRRAGGADDAVLDACLASGVLVPDGDGVRFRHELGRRAVESAVPPATRRRLHAALLQALDQADEPADPARLAHHAEAAEDREALLRHARTAGHRAAEVGAHRQAAEQYARALAAAVRLPLRERAELLEQRAFECYLTDQPGAALEARTAALALWREVGDPLREGDTLRWLSRLAWYSGRGEEALHAAQAAIEVLERLPPGRELALAWSNRAQLAMLAGDVAATVAWGGRALALAEQLDDPEVVAHALNNTGTALANGGDPEGLAQLRRSLQVAQDARLEEHVARAWCNLVSVAVTRHDAAAADAALEASLAYTVERDLDFWRWYLLGWQARQDLQQDRWDAARTAAEAVLAHARSTPPSRINALTALGRLRVRRGEDPGGALDEALALARATGELQRLAPVAAARAEAAWLDGEAPGPELLPVLALAQQRGDDWTVAELSWWAARHVLPVPDVPGTSPWALHLQGDAAGAVAAWRAQGAGYEAALACLDLDEADLLREAARDLSALGARPLLRRVAARLRALGAGGVPRGPRPSTGADPHGLTEREREVLALVAEGLTSSEVARRLVLSRRTVDHHVAAALRKLGTTSRADAVRRLADA